VTLAWRYYVKPNPNEISSGSAALAPSGTGASAIATSGPTGGASVSLKVSGMQLSSVMLSGTGVSVVSLAVTESSSRGRRADVRLLAARLPDSAAEATHYVDGWPPVLQVFASGAVG
jgi:hypothetical protein